MIHLLVAVALADEPELELLSSASIGCDATRLQWSLGRDTDVHCHAGFEAHAGRLLVHTGPFIGYGDHTMILFEGDDASHEHEESGEAHTEWVERHSHMEFGAMLQLCADDVLPGTLCSLTEVHDDWIIASMLTMQVRERWAVGAHVRAAQVRWDAYDTQLAAAQYQIGPVVQWNSASPLEHEGVTTFTRASMGWGRYAQPHTGRTEHALYLVLTLGFDTHPSHGEHEDHEDHDDHHDHDH